MGSEMCIRDSFNAHNDFFDTDHYNFLLTGNRLATVLVYLSNVQSGGHTVFPKLDISAKPRAGSALVWFNLDPRNGEPLNDTLHAACPVNIGQKWIINKWIRTHNKKNQSSPITQ